MKIDFQYMLWLMVSAVFAGCGQTNRSGTPLPERQTPQPAVGSHSVGQPNDPHPNNLDSFQRPNHSGSNQQPINPGSSQPSNNPPPHFSTGTSIETTNSSAASGEYLGTSDPTEREVTYAANGLSSTYKIKIPVDNRRGSPHGVLMYFHGDTAGDYKNNWNQVKNSAAKHQLIALSFLAPNRDSWWQAQEAYTSYIHRFIQQELYRLANVDKNRLVFAGVSGGSTFISGQFLPVYGNHYRGGAIMMCGGARFGSWTARLNPTQEFINWFRIVFYAGTEDYMYQQYIPGLVRLYETKGIPVLTEYPNGVEHCQFAKEPVMDKYLPTILSAQRQ